MGPEYCSVQKGQGNRKLKVEELHSDLQCPANARIAPPQAAAKLNPRPSYYSDLAIALTEGN